MPDYALRAREVTLTCVKCGRPFATRRRQIYCSSVCRRAANVERQVAKTTAELTPRPDSTPAST
jgi:hypothetical protein